MSFVARLSVLACVTLGISCGSSSVKLSSVGVAMYTRLDDNDTVVYAPRTDARIALGDSGAVNVSYTMDSWTGASVDITTAATNAVHEIRNEVNVGASYEFDSVTLAAGYRYSTENDYWSNGGVVSLTADLFDNNTTLGFAVMGSLDEVGRSGYPWSRRPLNSIGGQATISQVLDRKTVLQLSWETMYFDGFLASPYRYVAVYEASDLPPGTTPSGTCAVPPPMPVGEGGNQAPTEMTGPASFCAPETHPGRRLRQAAWVQVRRALGDRVSLGASYRFYFDDWGVRSNTIWPRMSVLAGDHGTFVLDYRFYTQGAADFYQSMYFTQQDALPNYYSRDRKLSPMFTNRVGMEYQHEFPFGEYDTNSVSAALRGTVTRFNYQDFIGLKTVDALELTIALGFNFD